MRKSLKFIIDHPVSAIFLECGLGKSVITLTAIKELLDKDQVHKILIIAPLRVASTTWPDEIAKWDHTSALSYSLITGSENQRRASVAKKSTIYIINRENIVWLTEQYIFDFDMVVIDELSSFKSPKSKRFRAFMKVRKSVKRIVGLTGTPASNGLMDLFGEFKVLDMGQRLGRSITAYRARYFVPNHRYGNIIYDYKLRPGAEDAIYKAVDDITISMKSKDYLKLPPVTFVTDLVQMNQKEKAKYKKLKKEMILELKDDTVDAKNAAVLASKLIQLSNGCIIGDHSINRIHDKKLDKLEDLIESSNGNPVLVVYWFRHDLERIKERFPSAVHLLDAKQIRNFNNGCISIGLMHPSSLGLGVNLQKSCNQLIWFGPIWSLDLYQQTNARIYRQGQTHTVIIHHIITKGTIDERIMKVLRSKEKTQDDFIQAVKADLSSEDPDLLEFPFLA